MSNYEQQTNSGVLFKNDRKEKPTHPDYTGRINIEGTEHWLSCWLKDGAKGKFMSLAIGDPVRQQSNKTHSAPSRQSSAASDFDDDIPF